MILPRLAALLMSFLCAGIGLNASSTSWLEFTGKSGLGKGKKIVLISGDEEYRSEEALPQLAKILSVHHGFDCVVLFAVDPITGIINPNNQTNIPGLENLKTADLMIIFTRFRDLPDSQMRQIVEYVEAGKPIIGLRTATHAFDLKQSKTYHRFTWNSQAWPGGFGKQILGETWVNHHGQHGKQGTRGIVVASQHDHPILRGIKDGDIFGATDVYGVNQPLPQDSQPLVLGEVTSTLQADSPAVAGKVNNPMMPIAWIKTYELTPGKRGRVFTSTLGASEDLLSQGTRQLFVNACYWAVGLESAIMPDFSVDFVGTFKPSPFRFNGFVTGRKPSDYRN